MLNDLEQVLDIATGLLALCTTLAGFIFIDRRRRKDNSIEALLEQSAIPLAKRRAILASIKRSRIAALALLVLCTALFLSSLWLAYSWKIQESKTARELLTEEDDAVFDSGTNSLFEVARAYPTRSSVETEAALSKVIDGAASSFDLFALTGTVLASVEENILAAIRRGVRVRLMLTDFGPDNAAAVDGFLNAMKVEPAAHKGRAKQTYQLVSRLIETVNRDRSVYKGSLDARWLSLPFHNSCWIVDASGIHPMAHVAVTFYKAENGGPCVRFGSHAANSIDQVAREFDTLWQQGQREPSKEQ